MIIGFQADQSSKFVPSLVLSTSLNLPRLRRRQDCRSGGCCVPGRESPFEGNSDHGGQWGPLGLPVETVRGTSGRRRRSKSPEDRGRLRSDGLHRRSTEDPVVESPPKISPSHRKRNSRIRSLHYEWGFWSVLYETFVEIVEDSKGEGCYWSVPVLRSTRVRGDRGRTSVVTRNGEEFTFFFRKTHTYFLLFTPPPVFRSSGSLPNLRLTSLLFLPLYTWEESPGSFSWPLYSTSLIFVLVPHFYFGFRCIFHRTSHCSITR